MRLPEAVRRSRWVGKPGAGEAARGAEGGISLQEHLLPSGEGASTSARSPSPDAPGQPQLKSPADSPPSGRRNSISKSASAGPWAKWSEDLQSRADREKAGSPATVHMFQLENERLEFGLIFALSAANNVPFSLFGRRSQMYRPGLGAKS